MPDEFLPTPPAIPDAAELKLPVPEPLPEPTLPGFEAPTTQPFTPPPLPEPEPVTLPPLPEPVAPTLGRIVHYYDGHGFGPYAAIVTGVQEGGRADLTVFRSGTAHPDWDVAVPFAPSKVEFGPTWTWPPRA